MESNANNIIDFEEVTNTMEEAEEPRKEKTSGGSAVAGFVGGLVAYVMIDGVKRLWQFAKDKFAETKRAKAETVVEDQNALESDKEDEQ